MIVALQALSYGLGHMLWTKFENGLIKEFILRSKSSKDLATLFKKTSGHHFKYVFKMLLSEVLLMIIVAANYLLTNWYLKWTFWAFGILDVSEEVFPKEGISYYILNTVITLSFVQKF